MNHSLWLGLAAGVLSISVQASAEARKLSIQSKADQYELILNGNSGTVNGKAADLSTFKDLIPIITSPLTNDCPTLTGPAEVTVREGGQARYIYLKQGVVSDGKTCLIVGGEGLYYFPIHRDFLIGSKRETIDLKSPLKVFRQGVKLFELKKTGQSWTPSSSTLLLNWDFLERFESSLHAFDIRFRVLPGMGEGKTKMIVQSGDKNYEFYKLSNVMWAVKKPGTAWLEATDDFSFWYDFDNGVLEDRFSPDIKAYEDAKEKADRLSALQKLEGSWSPNLRDLYHKIVLDQGADQEVKAIALKRLRAKPSKETSAVMAKFMAESIDEDFRKTASQILKINFPKGPIYNPNSPPEERKKVVEFWTQWAAKNQNAP
ncbi:MAG: hypothetical protein ACXVA9_05505 [Bdellovibrionales bacterium]